MPLYSSIKKFYRSAIPAPIRTFLYTNPLTRSPREWLLRRVEGLAGNEEIYDAEYYKNAVDGPAASSMPIMARSLDDVVHPASVIDVGCGSGQMLLAFQALGKSVKGLEYSLAAIDICRTRGLEVQRFDLEQAVSTDWHADLVISTEVAEHLPERCADGYVELLCRLGDTVFITAAVPGSTGTDHVNEQPNSYWIQKFATGGLAYQQEQSLKWREEWKAAGVVDWYFNSAMLFKRVS